MRAALAGADVAYYLVHSLGSSDFERRDRLAAETVAAEASAAGLRQIELPPGLTFGTVQRLHRAGIIPAPVTDLRFVVYPWVVDCLALRQAGWKPAFGNSEALQVLLEQRAGHHAVAGRRLDRKDATITAAGAVAVIGTAAIVREVRRRRRGT